MNKDRSLWENNLLIEDFSGIKLLFTEGEVASGGKYLPPATATEVKVFYYHINYCVLQGFAWGWVANQSAPLTLSVVFVYTNCLCHIAIMNISDLKPGSFLISSSIPLVFFSASSSALDALNPFLAKSMAGWTRRFHGNRPCRFQASNWPRTSPGTAMDRPPKIKTC